MSVQFHDVRWGAGGREIVRGVTAHIAAGRLVGLVGPNGCGKSSLLRLLAGMRTPDAGSVEIGGRPVASLTRRELARELAFVDQMAFAQDDYTVRQIVELGRAPLVGRWAHLSAHDHDAATRAMDDMGLLGLESARWARLSGGERQRTHIARALAQDTPIVILDEPLNHLDIHHQIVLLDRLRHIASTGRSVVMSVHDLTVAVRSCDALAVMADGELVTTGDPVECLRADVVRRVFGVESTLESCSHGRPLLALHDACGARPGRWEREDDEVGRRRVGA